MIPITNCQPSPKEKAAVRLASYLDYPTLQTVGDAMKVSRERVRQIAAIAGITKWLKKRRPYVICPICGSTYRKIHVDSKTCSKACSKVYIKAHRNPTVMTRRICESCGGVFFRKTYLVRKASPARFCSKKCQGSWVGKHYGKGRPV